MDVINRFLKPEEAIPKLVQYIRFESASRTIG